VNVTILYRLSDEETWNTLANVTTVDGGTHSCSWTPEKAGTYAVKSSWQGDNMTMPNQSEVLIVTVQEAPPPSLFLYSTVALAIAIVVITFYFLKTRKPKSNIK